MSSVIYNATNTFLSIGYTDINIWYFLVGIAVVLFVASVYIASKIPYDKFILSLLSFLVMIGCLLMSANLATYHIQPQWNENTTAWNGYANTTVSHIYNQSQVDVIPMNSLPLSVISLIMTIFMFGNFAYNLASVFDTKDVKDMKMKVEAE